MVGQDTQSGGYSDAAEGPVNFRGKPGEKPAFKPCKPHQKWSKSPAGEGKSIGDRVTVTTYRPARVGSGMDRAGKVTGVLVGMADQPTRCYGKLKFAIDARICRKALATAVRSTTTDPRRSNSARVSSRR